MAPLDYSPLDREKGQSLKLPCKLHPVKQPAWSFSGTTVMLHVYSSSYIVTFWRTRTFSLDSSLCSSNRTCTAQSRNSMNICQLELHLKQPHSKRLYRQTILVAQWLRICNPMQGSQVQSLVWELRSHAVERLSPTRKVCNKEPVQPIYRKRLYC